MAFTFTKTLDWVDRGVRHTAGTFTASAAEETGEIYTGLSQIQGVELQHQAAAVIASEPAVNEVFPCHDPVTVVMTAGGDGYWHAFGS